MSGRKSAKKNPPVKEEQPEKTKKQEGPKLGFLIIFVKDVKKTSEFWANAFGFTVKFTHESGEYIEMQTGDTVLAFSGESFFPPTDLGYRPNNPTESPPGVTVSVNYHDPKALFDLAVKNGAVAVKDVELKPWNWYSGYVRDINGILVEISCKKED